MNQKFVTSVAVGFGEPVIVSTGSGDAGKVVGLGQDGKLDPSVLPEQCYSMGMTCPPPIPKDIIQFAPAMWYCWPALSISL